MKETIIILDTNNVQEAQLSIGYSRPYSLTAPSGITWCHRSRDHL